MAHELPGQYDLTSQTPRTCLYSNEGLEYHPGGAVLDEVYSIDGKNTSKTDEIRPGTPLAYITGTKKWCPTKRSLLNGAAADDTDIVVDDARAFKVGDTISVDGGANTTISAIDYDTDTLTVAAGQTADDGSTVVASGALAGAGTTRLFLDEHAKLTNEEGTAVPVSVGKVFVGAYIDANKVLGDLAAIKAAAGRELQGFRFTDDHGV